MTMTTCSTSLAIILSASICSQVARAEVRADPELNAIQAQIDDHQAKIDELNKLRVLRLKALRSQRLADEEKGWFSRIAPVGLDTTGEAAKRFSKEYNLKVRQSVFSKTGAQDAARFQYSMPSGASDSWTIDAGIGVENEFLSLPDLKMNWRLQAEGHYLDEGTSEKNSYILGGGLDIFQRQSSGNEQLYMLDFGYKRDEMVAGDAFLATLSWLPTYERLRIGDFSTVWGPFRYRFEPTVGVEAETGDGAIKGVPDGDRLSLRAGMTVVTSIFPDTFGNRLEANLSGSWWFHPSLSGAYETYSDHQFAFSSSLTYWLDRASAPGVQLKDDEKHFGLSARYLNGNNPLTAEFDQNIWTFGLSVKY